VPPAFVLSTELCRDYLHRGAAALSGLAAILDRERKELGARTGRYFGDAKRPLLVSVRSGAAISMPGMMETVLAVRCYSKFALGRKEGHVDYKDLVELSDVRWLGASAVPSVTSGKADKPQSSTRAPRRR
jgi:pyruvate,orthophosphate dikinase